MVGSAKAVLAAALLAKNERLDCMVLSVVLIVMDISEGNGWLSRWPQHRMILGRMLQREISPQPIRIFIATDFRTNRVPIYRAPRYLGRRRSPCRAMPSAIQCQQSQVENPLKHPAARG